MGSNLLTRLFYSNLNRFAMEFTRVGIFCIGGGGCFQIPARLVNAL